MEYELEWQQEEFTVAYWNSKKCILGNEDFQSGKLIKNDEI